jgi:hypothetical protein
VKFLEKKNPQKISFTQAPLLPQIPQRTTQKKMILIDLKIALSLSLVARSRAAQSRPLFSLHSVLTGFRAKYSSNV